MDTNDKPQTAKQVCTIRIAFPVETDEQAIKYKKQLGDILADIPEVVIGFYLATTPFSREIPVPKPITQSDGLA